MTGLSVARLSLQRPFPAGLLLLASVVLATACSGPEQAPPVTGDPHLEYALELARESGDASAEQIEILEAAIASGSLSFADYKSAIESSLACMNDAGLVTAGPEPDDSWGFPRLTYTVLTGDIKHSSQDDAQKDAEDSNGASSPAEQPAERVEGDNSNSESPKQKLAENCRDRHSAFVELAYTEQPASLQAQDAYLESGRPGVLACAGEAGIALDADLPIRELLAQLIDAGEPGRQCLYENDISAF